MLKLECGFVLHLFVAVRRDCKIDREIKIVEALIIITIIIAFKGANRDFLQSPHCAPNNLQRLE